MRILYVFIIFLQFLRAKCSQYHNSTDNVTEILERFKLTWAVDNWKKFGFFSDEYILQINIHWLKYPPPYTSSFYTIGILYIIFMVFGITGNSLVIFLFIKCKSLRTPGNTLILNLAISDGLMTMKAPILIYNSFVQGPALGDTACRLYGFVGGLTGTLSIMTLCVISFDRYFVIKYPLNRSFADVRIKLCLIVTWIYGTFFASIPVLDIGFGKYTYEGYLTSCSFDYLTDDMKIKVFIYIFFVAAWVIPLTLITFCYINILKVVSNRTVSQKKGRDSFRHVKEEDNKKQELKLALIVFSTIILWFFSWTPYAVVALLGVSGYKDWISPLASMIPALFCKTASCLNSYVYALSHPKFKTELRKICCTSLRKKTDRTQKVWTTDYSKEESKDDFVTDKNDEGSTSTLSYTEGPPEFTDNKPQKTLKRQETIVEMICLRPSFKNNPSNIRKLARRWSSKEKQKGDEDDANANVDMVPVG